MSFLKSLILGSDDTKSEFSEISIHDNLLILPASVIQLSNISRITAYAIKKTWSTRITLLLLSLGSIGVAQEQGGFTYVVAGIFSALFIYSMIYKRFGLQIQTNGSTTDFIITKSQEISDKLYSMILYFMNNLDKKMEVTIDKSLNIINGDKIMGDKFSDIEKSTIINKSNVEKE